MWRVCEIDDGRRQAEESNSYKKEKKEAEMRKTHEETTP
jgi:hypothetical protein